MKGIVSIGLWGVLGVFCLAQTGKKPALSPALSPPPQFTMEEREAILAQWYVPGRYEVKLPPEAQRSGPWQVRLTPTGSQWLWDYNRLRGIPKGNPGQVPGPQNAEQVAWEKWIDARVSRDRWEAGQFAAKLNAGIQGRNVGSSVQEKLEAPANPGPMPPGLQALAGPAPSFASAVTPLLHVVTFDDKRQVALADNPAMQPRYAYYRNPQGVMSGGKRLKDIPEERLKSFFDRAGVSPKERKAMAAVSSLEGGFESVNTYDTGFVSVGVIQFACLKEGGGALGRMLLRFKADAPEEYQTYLRRFGVDVTPEGLLAVIDPDTGAERIGPDAAQAIIDDKRLIAVFCYAGDASDAFKVAQLSAAKAEFLPSEMDLSIDVKGKTLNGKVSDVIRSEAGLAILMDRKVNTGGLGQLIDLIAVCAEEMNASSLKDLAKYERDICVAMRFRTDFLADGSLSQPGPAVNSKRNYRELASRRASRNGRGGE